MSWPDIPAFRMRYPAAASPPNPPPTICAFICLLPELRVGRPPDPGPGRKQRSREFSKEATSSRRRWRPATVSEIQTKLSVLNQKFAAQKVRMRIVEAEALD